MDSHANMVVCDKHCHILSQSEINAMVSAFTNNVGTMQIPIVDAVIPYNCPDTNKVWLLIIRNGLFLESMNHNLVPPFILQEGGMEVYNRPKIHHPKGTPSIINHTFDNAKHRLRIPFKLSWIFSMFNSRKPTDYDFINGTPIVITPEGDDWSPNSS